MTPGYATGVCAHCHRAADTRLYNVLGANGNDRHEWCADCLAMAVRLGASVTPAPQWIERAWRGQQHGRVEGGVAA